MSMLLSPLLSVLDVEVLFTTASSMPGVLDTRATTPSAVATDAVVPLLLDEEGNANSIVSRLPSFKPTYKYIYIYIYLYMQCSNPVLSKQEPNMNTV
jgi:hypothetical protein